LFELAAAFQHIHRVKTGDAHDRARETAVDAGRLQPASERTGILHRGVHRVAQRIDGVLTVTGRHRAEADRDCAGRADADCAGGIGGVAGRRGERAQSVAAVVQDVADIAARRRVQRCSGQQPCPRRKKRHQRMSCTTVA
jgi:hypothetical protein